MWRFYNGYRHILETLFSHKLFLGISCVIVAAIIYGGIATLYGLTDNRHYVWLVFSSFTATLAVTIASGWARIGFLQRDVTTGLYRRIYIEELLLRLGGNRTDVTIAIVDLNGLREVNNRHGHSAGDNFLQLAARRLQVVIGRRKNRWVGRLGGDEFIVVATGHIECASLASDVEEALHARHPINDAFGLGVAGIARTRRGETKSALECADMALLRAKKEFYTTKIPTICRYDVILDGIPKLTTARPTKRLRDQIMR